MKNLTKIFATIALLFAMVSCGNPVKDAKAAIEEKNFVKAAKSLSSLTVDDINNMDEAELAEFFTVCMGIGFSGDKEANEILENDSFKKVIDAAGAVQKKVTSVALDGIDKELEKGLEDAFEL